MATKKYLSYDRLAEYDALIKTKIDEGDESTLSSSKAYTDEKIAEIPEVDAYTKSEIDTVLLEKADKSHNHDDVYYTEAEVDALLIDKSDISHTHNDKYDAKGAANTAVSTHNTSIDAHNDIRVLITDLTTKLNNFLDVDDTTVDQLSEVITLIDNNKGTLESLTTSKVNVSDIIDNLTTASANKVLSANQGVAIKVLIDALQEAVNGKAASSHTHAISDVTNLETALDGKAALEHDHDATEITSGTLSSDRLPVIPVAKGGTGATDAATARTNLEITPENIGAATSNHTHDDRYYTETEIDNMVFITVDDIDAICGTTIQMASEVKF